MQFSTLLNRFSESETLRLAKLGRELKAKGIDIIDFSLGEPDFNTPAHIKEAGIKAIQDNWSHYTPVSGYQDLREAICQKFKRDNNLSYTPDQIVASTGAKQSLANVILSLIDEGDEVIIPTPYWVTYSELVKIARGIPKIVRTKTIHRLKITPEELAQAITPTTKMFLFSSPCNPSGSVYTKQELVALVEILKKHPQIIVVSDEIYEYINYIGKHESIAQFADIYDRTVVVNGLSKGYAMTGWRLGYIAAHKDIAKACDKLQGQFTSGTCSIAQRAAITALTANHQPSIDMTKEFTKRKEKVLQFIKEIPHISIIPPDGAFYVFPNMSYYFNKTDGTTKIKNASDLSMFLLENAHVSSVMGDAFGEPDCIRFSFACSTEKIEEGWKRIGKALNTLHL